MTADMIVTFRPGDEVRHATDGRTGQVWSPAEQTAEDDINVVTVASYDGEFWTAYPRELELVARQLPDAWPKGITAKRVKARKTHDCHSDIHGGRPPIRPGQMYVRAVAFPGSDLISSDATRPVAINYCDPCAAAFAVIHPSTLATRSSA